MSKARTLANLISDNAELADGQISVAEVVGAAPLANPTFTGTATGTFSGPLTGDVTGNVTGAVTGNIAGDLDLTAIAKDISDTAVDVFVYDTSKDSDGGAWRHRTQHTSWYNETLNTSTRGSRKEFPAVAVIVAEATQVTIYDGDDPDLPMWMVINKGTTLDLAYGANGVVTSISALNSIIAVGGAGTDGVYTMEFVSDIGYRYRDDAVVGNRGTYLGGIAERDNNRGWAKESNKLIVNDSVNDVAMTVLPNAPIDAATGLPVPTIAVATNGGTSVITDSGAVHDITGFSPVENVNFYGDKLAINTTVGSTSYINIGPSNLSNDTASSAWKELEINSTNTNDFKILNNQAAHQALDDNYYSAGSVGLLSVKPDYAAPETCLHSFTSSSYNTGYQVGDIKLATLSDTDDTDVTGSDYTSTFSTVFSTSGRVTTYSYTNGSNTVVLDDDGVSAGDGYVALAFTPTVSGRFLIKMVADNSFTPTTGYNNFVRIGTTGTVLDTLTATEQSDLTNVKYLEFDGVSGTEYTFNLYSNYSGGNLTYTFNIYKAEEDRSVNGNGLQVFGTVTKNPVATGADLVGYSGFSASNYLIQPYNSDLDFGTGDFCFMGWFNSSTVSRDYILHRYSASGFVFVRLNSSTGTIQMSVDSSGGTIANSINLTGGAWHSFTSLRRSGFIELYVDGISAATPIANSTNITDTDSVLYIGNDSTLGRQFDNGSLALLRISATAPSPEQIAKIYNDEKHLFQTGAQATLYGSSDAVTAMAYDDSTDLLHVGTSAGRSVFQGLRRVDNTTDAVGAAISASNGLVAED